MAKKAKAPKAKTRAKSGRLTVKDLVQASADYNPRVISDKRLRALKTSYETYGDLSGIVLNRTTDTIVSGHQRLKTLKGKKTRVVTEKHTDEYGTVEIGHVEVVEKNGTLSKIPFRVVEWSDRKAEKAANIAANAHGGDFDNNKLAKLLEEIEPREEFEIERLGLDPLTIRQLAPVKPLKESKDSDDEDEEQEEKGGFKEYDEDSFQLENCCPRCKFKW